VEVIMVQRMKFRVLMGTLALLLLGVLVSAMYTSAGAHVSNSVRHLWKEHIEPRTDHRYVPRYFAAVNTDGSLARRNGVASADNLSGAGKYEVVFRRNVRSCAYIATVGSAGLPDDEPLPGLINVADRKDTPQAVYVQTFNGNGDDRDRPFHIQVVC
jgi:hypothetical protein